MNFWHMQIHPDDQSEITRSDALNIIEKKQIIGMGKSWDNDRNQPQKFSSEMKVGDVVLIRSDGPLALVKIISDCFDNEDNTIWFKLVRRVEVISKGGKSFKEQYKRKKGKNWNEGLYLPTTLEMANQSKFISFWYNSILKNKKMKDIKDILLFKHQIILQGPPGTGKTRLAKEIATNILTKSISKSPLNEIKDFLTNHVVTDAVQLWRNKRDETLTDFQRKFPIDQLLQLNLETYCIGKSNKDNFCWWIERGLESFGRYSPGFSINYGVYFSKTEQKFKTLKRYSNPEEAVDEMKTFVCQVAKEEFNAEGFKKIGDGFILKILASYYPEKYIQVYKPEILIQISRLLKLDSKSHYIQLSQELNNRIKELIYETSSNCDTREVVNFLFQKFLGGNDTEILEEEQTIISKPTIVQFHPSYSYEDFVRGIVAEEKDGQIKYAVQNKTLAEIAKKAIEDKDSPYVLIIDEINRANLSSVLGELIYALEYRNEPVNSMYALEDSNVNEYEIIIPSNLYIIGTMNTSDRSVGHIDYAIRRRFAFVDVLPEVLSINDFQKNTFKKVSSLFIMNLDEYESNPKIKLQKSNYLNNEFKPEDVWLGHSYFIAKDEDFGIRKKYEIVPILKEYVKDGILKDTPETWKLIDEIAE